MSYLENRADVTPDQATAWRTADRHLRAFQENYDAEMWMHIGMCAFAIQLTAQDEAGVNEPKGTRYLASRNRLTETLPHLRDLDKQVLDDAIWLGKTWEKVKPWLDSLTTTERLKLCFPHLIRLKWDRTFNPSEKDKSKSRSQNTRALDRAAKVIQERDEEISRLNEALTALQAERDALQQEQDAIRADLSAALDDVDLGTDSPDRIRKIIQEKPHVVEIIIRLLRRLWPHNAKAPSPRGPPPRRTGKNGRITRYGASPN